MSAIDRCTLHCSAIEPGDGHGQGKPPRDVCLAISQSAGIQGIEEAYQHQPQSGRFPRHLAVSQEFCGCRTILCTILSLLDRKDKKSVRPGSRIPARPVC